MDQKTDRSEQGVKRVLGHSSPEVTVFHIDQMKEFEASMQRAQTRDIVELKLEEELYIDRLMEECSGGEGLEEMEMVSAGDVANDALRTIIESLTRRVDALEEEVANLRMALTDRDLGEVLRQSSPEVTTVYLEEVSK
jgi:hypothetical protein